MESLTQNHSTVTNPGIPPKLKPFKAVARKLSSLSWKGLLSIAVASSVLGTAAGAMAISPGAVGPGVARLQAALGIPVDGIYGRQTAAAVAAFQRCNGLLVDGVAGPQTLSALGGGCCSSGCHGNSYRGYSSSYSHSDGDYQPYHDDHHDDDYSGPPDYSYTKPPTYIQPGPHPPYDSGYVVVIPGNGADLLSKVQQYGFPQAAIDGTDRGAFINVGTYPRWSDAIYVANRLKGFGFAARVAAREEILDHSR